MVPPSQFYVEEEALRNGEVEQHCLGVAVDLALLSVQEGLDPGFHVPNNTAPDISR
jgi:hypothetical protein